MTTSLKLRNILEEWSFEHYVKNNPSLVEGIKKLLVAGEKPSNIRAFVKKVSGSEAPLTASTIGHLIDYCNKQIKN